MGDYFVMLNTKKIIAELRRSACEDEFPWGDLGQEAFEQMVKWKIVGQDEFFFSLLY